MGFPRSLIDKIVADEDLLVAVAREYTSLKKQRGKYIGLCVFHAERSPSFSIPRNKSPGCFYHCFGCGAHGSVIDLVRHTKTIAHNVDWAAGPYTIDGIDVVTYTPLHVDSILYDIENGHAAPDDPQTIARFGFCMSQYMRDEPTMFPITYPEAVRYLAAKIGIDIKLE